LKYLKANILLHISSSVRFTGEAVIKVNGVYPFTLNQYAYCWNHPITFNSQSYLIEISIVKKPKKDKANKK